MGKILRAVARPSLTVIVELHIVSPVSSQASTVALWFRVREVATMDRHQEFVLRTIEEQHVRFVRLWFPDVLGYIKSVAIAPAELEQAFAEGIGFDGSAIEGFARVFESDLLARPDAATFQLLPARSDGTISARMFCDIVQSDGSASAADSRYALKRTLAAASTAGFSFYTHPEVEFFLLSAAPTDGQVPQPVDAAGYFDHTPQPFGHDFRRKAIAGLESMGISVEYSHHEAAPGQQEIDLRYADALTTADNLLTFRHLIKELALEHQVYATFMPKPFTEHPGSGMHTHLSLFEGERNAFHDPSGPFCLSQVGRAFIAGLLHHAAEITAVTNQWVNSYKRLWAGLGRTAAGGGEAPAYICWGHNNRSALVRVPMYKPHKGNSTRVELRSPDPACNPYLAFAVMLAAGLRGIAQGYELPEAAEDDVWLLTEKERRALGIAPLPSDLKEAIALTQNSDLVAETLGEHLFDYFLANKQQEWADYRRQVHAYERGRYLAVL